VTDTSIGALARADVDAALTYAECAARQAATVNAYLAARDAARAWQDDRTKSPAK
jgi:hypothetical protein